MKDSQITALFDDSTSHNGFAMSTKQVIIDDHEATGRTAQERRWSMGVGLRELARRMGLSASYVCDLEHGRRAWNEDRIRRYVDGLEACIAGMKPEAKNG